MDDYQDEDEGFIIEQLQRDRDRVVLFLEKLLEYRDSDYVPNTLFERAEELMKDI